MKNNNSINKGKALWKPGTMLAPIPVVMVTSKGSTGNPNIITIGWTGTICSEPAMLSISVRPERHSYKLIKESGEFVVNIPSKKLARETDLCGVISGRDHDKFHETGLTAGKANTVSAPIIMECPISLECKVKQEIPLGSHNMFLAEITAVQVSEEFIDEKGAFTSEKAQILGYTHGNYCGTGKSLGTFGFSVKKK